MIYLGVAYREKNNCDNATETKVDKVFNMKNDTKTIN